MLHLHKSFYVDGAINWDIAALVGAFGLTLLLSQVLSSQGMPANPQQSTANKITPVMITGMFLFFPLPAGSGKNRNIPVIITGVILFAVDCCGFAGIP